MGAPELWIFCLRRRTPPLAAREYQLLREHVWSLGKVLPGVRTHTVSSQGLQSGDQGPALPSWFPISNRSWLFGGRQGSPRVLSLRNRGFQLLSPRGIYLPSVGEECRIWSPLVNFFSAQDRERLFSKEPILALSQGVARKALC